MPKPETHSDPLSEDGQSIECPWCSEFISEELDNVEPDCGPQEVTCPNCAKGVFVTLEILNQYTAVPAQGKLTLATAIKTSSCRICGKKMDASGLTLNFGKEFAHTECLEKQK